MLLEPQDRLYLGAYAQLGEPVPGVLGRVYGLCPFYWPAVPRFVVYQGRTEYLDGPDGLSLDTWASLYRRGDENKLCAGDSGGVVVQNGQVVGIITSIVDSEHPIFAFGTVMKAVPTKFVTNLLMDAYGE